MIDRLKLIGCFIVLTVLPISIGFLTMSPKRGSLDNISFLEMIVMILLGVIAHIVIWEITIKKEKKE